MGNPGLQIFWMLMVIAIGFLVCSGGLQNGVEKITTVMMSCLFVVIIILIVRSVTLPGAAEGLKFYLVPNFQAMKEQGIMTVGFCGHGAVIFYLKPWNRSNRKFLEAILTRAGG